MATLKNMDKRLITINHGGKRYDIKCGNNPAVEVPDEACKSDFVKHLIETGKLVSTGATTTTATDPSITEGGDVDAEMRAEFEAMTVKELEEHAKMLDLEGYSSMNKAELVGFILENS